MRTNAMPTGRSAQNGVDGKLREHAARARCAVSPRRRPRWNRLLVGLALVLVFSQPPSIGKASIFGEDTVVLSGILKENIAQLTQMAKMVTGVYTQIKQLTTMIEQGSTMLQRVHDPQDVLRVLRFGQQLLRKGGALEGKIDKLRFKLQDIDDDREATFPELQDLSSEEIQAKARKWNGALQESSAVAMRAQTSVETLEARLAQATAIQKASENSEGIVAQLQLVVKQLGVLHTDLAAIEQNLAYGQRVTATMAGVQAAEQERANEESSRMLKNYRDRGAPGKRLDALP